MHAGEKRKANGTLGLVVSSAAGRDDDRLSSLPDDLIGRILSLLPTTQAVLASQLSRRWRRVWAHVGALNLSVRDCVRRGDRGRPRLCALAREALLRFPTPDIPSLSVEINRKIHLVDEWYSQAMARAVGSVRVTSPRGLIGLDFPPCTRAEALAVALPRTVLTLPDLAGRLAELSLSLVRLRGAHPALGEFLASCCPRLRMLSVRGASVRRLSLRTDVFEVLDLSNVDDLTSLDVSAANLRHLSVHSCFRSSPRSGGGEVVVSAPRIQAVSWHRSYPKELSFCSDLLANARWLGGPALGRRDNFDAPYTMQLLRLCSLVRHLDLELLMPDEMTLLSWLGSEGAGEDLIQCVPQLPNVSVLSLKIRWGFGGGIVPSLASLLSRTPTLTRLHMELSPYCFVVYEGQEPPPPQGGQRWESSVRTENGLRLDGLREVSVHGLKGADHEEYRILELFLRSAPRSRESATEVPARFPMATGRWERSPPSVLTWIKLQDVR